MTERPPQLPHLPPGERTPVAYEQVLEAARGMHAAGLEPFPENIDIGMGGGNSDAQATWDMLEAWEAAESLNMAGAETPEKARGLVRAATIWLDAGYTQPEIFEAALATLRDYYSLASTDNPAVASIFDEAIREIEAKLHAGEKRDSSRLYFEKKLEETQHLLEQNDGKGALGVAGLLPFEPKFKRLPKDLQDRVTAMAAAAKTLYDKQRGK